MYLTQKQSYWFTNFPLILHKHLPLLIIDRSNLMNQPLLMYILEDFFVNFCFDEDKVKSLVRNGGIFDLKQINTSLSTDWSVYLYFIQLDEPFIYF